MTLSGQFLLELNTYGEAVTVTTFQTKLDTGEVSATSPEAGLLATDPDTGLIVIGPVTIESGLRIVLQGDLVIASVVEIHGRFEFTFRTEPSFLIEVKVFAMASLLGIGEFEIDAVMADRLRRAGGLHLGVHRRGRELRRATSDSASTSPACWSSTPRRRPRPCRPSAPAMFRYRRASSCTSKAR